MSPTSKKVNPQLLDEIRTYGAFDITACFNCGNCTAVCPLSKEENSFPRKMIRSGQVGIKENIVNGMEPWLCYYCGECSETCPRQAEPGEYMAALRRYSIAQNDFTGLAKFLYRHTFMMILFTFSVAVLLSLFLVGIKGDPDKFRQWIFSNLVSYEAVHLVGTLAGIFAVILLTAGVVTYFKRLLKNREIVFKGQIVNAFIALLKEVLTMKRHGECLDESSLQKRPWYLRPRFVHGFILWGFLSLLFATTSDFFFIYLLGTDFYFPARLTGTIGGLMLMYGVSIAIWERIRRHHRHSRHTHPADAWLLFFLFMLGFTGFWLEIVVMAKIQGPLHDWILLIHAAMAMELVLLVAITKLAHAIYRPLSLFIYHLQQKAKELNNV